MHAYPLHDNPNRVMPTVPGINAGSLVPSIGCDHWRTSPNARLRHRVTHTPSSKARPITGTPNEYALPSGHERPRAEVPARVKPNARKRRAMAQADHAMRLSMPWN